jgi:hypothetical protein
MTATAGVRNTHLHARCNGDASNPSGHALNVGLCFRRRSCGREARRAAFALDGGKVIDDFRRDLIRLLLVSVPFRPDGELRRDDRWRSAFNHPLRRRRTVKNSADRGPLAD